MIDITFSAGIVMLLFALLFALIRLLKGPTIMDRVLCLDAITVCVIAIMVLLCLVWESPFYFDLILLFSIFGFFSTVAFSYFLHLTYPEHGKGAPPVTKVTRGKKGKANS